MAKNKTKRSLDLVGKAQDIAEKENADKFQAAKDEYAAQQVQKHKSTGRKSPLVGFTISEEDKKIMNDLTLYASNKKGKVVSKSSLQRELIRIGNKYKDEIDCE